MCAGVMIILETGEIVRWSGGHVPEYVPSSWIRGLTVNLKA